MDVRLSSLVEARRPLLALLAMQPKQTTGQYSAAPNPRLGAYASARAVITGGLCLIGLPNGMR